MLQELGFWCSKDEDFYRDSLSTDRPNPLRLVDNLWFANIDAGQLRIIKLYLTQAHVESYELAYSFCRFNCQLALDQPSVMGACTMTDGVYCWPEGYWHYINHHHVKPPHDFLSHVMQRFSAMADVTRKARREMKLLLWDDEEHKAIEMPQAMQDWITSYTTIKMVTEDS
ncbi:hypothetical protein CCR75_006392 [Bremia lactucae]|uniref:Uncharacterized protein n=1 Tax=Bremia lactucae TaxID=4779 RepID=A0A976IJK3_BRELC|nr:hypothetical protein CCR75_006392 [Bremia lactucae]